MKRKLIFFFLTVVVSSTIIIMMLSIVGYVTLEREQRGDVFPSGFPRDFARSFRVFIEFENGEVTILEDGKNLL